jgi:hypothetical protein
MEHNIGYVDQRAALQSEQKGYTSTDSAQINCGFTNTDTNYTTLLSSASGCTTLRCCMDYCDGTTGCIGTQLLLGGANTCYFFFPPNGTTNANSSFNIAYLYSTATQAVYITTHTFTTTTVSRHDGAPYRRWNLLTCLTVDYYYYPFFNSAN